MFSIAEKSPMGWNSWDCWGPAVTEDTVRKNAQFIAENLRSSGYEYVVVDIQWSAANAKNHEYEPYTELEMDEYSRLIPAVNRFPSAAEGKGFAPLAEYIHSLGLKFGIHIMRGIPRQAVHRNTAILGTEKTARDIVRVLGGLVVFETAQIERDLDGHIRPAEIYLVGAVCGGLKSRRCIGKDQINLFVDEVVDDGGAGRGVERGVLIENGDLVAKLGFEHIDKALGCGVKRFVRAQLANANGEGILLLRAGRESGDGSEEHRCGKQNCKYFFHFLFPLSFGKVF